MEKILFTTSVIFLLIVNYSLAQTPRTLSYQGVLTDALGNPKPDGQYKIVFRLYFNETGGIAQWTESKFIISSKGLFSTLLGDSVSFPSAMKWDAPYWISIQVDAGNELPPRIKLATTAYSFRAIIADNAVTVDDGAITATKLAPNSVTSPAIQDGSVQMSDIAQSGAATGQALVWNGSQWSPAAVSSGGSFTAGAGINIAGNVISNTGDLSNTNEIQSLSIAGNQLSLSNGGGSVTLPGGGTAYTAGAGINIAGNVISNTGDLNNTNEIQTLSLAGNQLSLSNGGGSVTLPAGGGTNYWTASGSNISNNNSGFVGIGTVSPTWKLDLQADGAAFRIDGVHPWMELWDGGTRGGYFRNLNGNIEIGTVGSNTAGILDFWAGGKNAMRLSAAGRLGIQTEGLDLKNDLTIESAPAGAKWSIATHYVSHYLYFSLTGKGIMAYLTDLGDWQTFSDCRLKKNIVPYHSVLDGVKRLNVCTYLLKNQSDDTRRSFGLIAQDVRDVFPELVSSGRDEKGEEFFGVSYEKTGVIALKAIQEQQIQIEKQQTRIEEQQTENEKQQAQIEDLKREVAELKRMLTSSTNTQR